MNLYLRYFDREILVPTVEDAIAFLSSIDEIEMNPVLEADIREYVESDVLYPKRYKVRTRVYFIIIKTEAATMQDFKDKKAVHTEAFVPTTKGQPTLARLNEIREGWYEGLIDFKRVLMVPGTGKFQYRDTQFIADVKAISGMDCYNRICEYLRERVDERSQFPSAKGKNFKFRFLGKAK
ncbi:MAG: hypothetical protein K5764_06180 [Prevotella sp.]|nr:hypothetical protein [Prevotella sp.]